MSEFIEREFIEMELQIESLDHPARHEGTEVFSNASPGHLFIALCYDLNDDIKHISRDITHKLCVKCNVSVYESPRHKAPFKKLCFYVFTKSLDITYLRDKHITQAVECLLNAGLSVGEEFACRLEIHD
jgi:hypothetical protein